MFLDRILLYYLLRHVSLDNAVQLTLAGMKAAATCTISLVARLSAARSLKDLWKQVRGHSVVRMRIRLERLGHFSRIDRRENREDCLPLGRVTAEKELTAWGIVALPKIGLRESEAVQMYSRRNGCGIWFRGDNLASGTQWGLTQPNSPRM